MNAILFNPPEKSPMRLQRRATGVAAMTIVETMVALCVMAIGFIGVWTSAAQCIRVAQAHREAIAATETLMQRVEDCRAAGWNTIVNAQDIQANILETPAADAGYLSNLTEQITVYPYPPVTPATTPIVVQRLPSGAVVIASQPAPGFYLRSVLAVRADFQATWTNSHNQPCCRQASTIISLEGELQ